MVFIAASTVDGSSLGDFPIRLANFVYTHRSVCRHRNSQFFKATTLNQVWRWLKMPIDRRESWLGLLSFGFFLMLFALFFVIVPDYGETVVGFFKDIEMKQVVPGVSLPAPGGPPMRNAIIYENVMHFCLIFGIFQFAILALRFYFRSTVRKVAETISNIVGWLGAAYAFSLLLAGTLEWFPFIGALIVVGGFSIIVRSIVMLLLWQKDRAPARE